MKYIESLALAVVRLVSAGMLTILLVYSVFNTTFLKDIEEHSFFLKDGPLGHIAVLAVVLVFLILVHRFLKAYWMKVEEKWARGLIMCSFVLGMSWILISQAMPTGDSYFIFKVAERLANGDTSDFLKGAYMYLCPNQNGIVLFLYLLQKIVGVGNYLFFQVLNVCALTLSQWFIYKIVLFFSKNIRVALLVLLAEICFLPAILYTSFTYGTLLGFACVTGAAWLSCRYFEEERIIYCVIASVLMAVATCFKSNYSICLVAMVLISVVYAVKKGNWKNILYPVLLIVGYLAITMLSEKTLEHLTGGLSNDNAFHAGAYLEMGLRESSYAPGWFNGYAYKVVRDSNFEKDVYEEIIKEDLKNSLVHFSENPEYAYSFFAQKTISQWCEPTFQSMWIILVRESALEETSMLRYWLVAPYSGANILIRDALNYFQTLIYIGALVFVLSERKKNIYVWSGMVSVIGGFLFHTLWEAKAQYTLNYFMLLIPYGVIGIYRLAKGIAQLLDKQTRARLVSSYREEKVLKVELLVFGILILLLTVFLLINGVSFANAADIEHYTNFMMFG